MVKHPFSGLDLSNFSYLPHPNGDLLGVPIFSPGWGPCWLGVKANSGELAFWHVTSDDRTEIDFDVIRCFVDPMTDNVWLIFYRSHDDASFPLLPCTGDECGQGWYVPPTIRELLT